MNEIADYIKQIFRHYPQIVMSWGIEYFVPIFECEEGEGGLEMKVNGFKHQGVVRIVLNWLDLFDVTLYVGEKPIRKIENIYIDNLVNVIDEAVEKTEDYEARVKAEYSVA